MTVGIQKAQRVQSAPFLAIAVEDPSFAPWACGVHGAGSYQQPSTPNTPVNFMLFIKVPQIYFVR